MTRSPLILYLFRQMDHRAAPAPADTLPSSICLELAHTLRKNLPAPVTDSPDDAARWERAAIEHAASLLPATADEANLAALYAPPAPRRWIACASPGSIPTTPPSC